MKKQPARLWILVALLGILFDYLFYKHTPGVNFAVFALLTITFGVIILRLDDIKPAKTTWLLIPLILFFLFISFSRLEPLSRLLSYGFTLFLMAGLVVTFRGGKYYQYSLADYAVRAFELLGSTLFSGLQYILETRRVQKENITENKESSRFWPIFRGIVLSIPVLAFFAVLLASADLIFAQRLNSLTQIFRLENLPELIFRFFYISIIAYVLAGVYIYAARSSMDEKLLGIENPLVPDFFGFTEASFILGSLVLLFTFFVTIQFQYFFGGQTNIDLTGYTYSEYARKGFGELVLVAFAVMLLFSGLTSITNRRTELKKRIFSGLGVTLLFLVGVILVSAYQRLVLYESAYGFTRLRTYTHVFMIWVAILLTVFVVLDILQKQRYFVLSAILAFTGFAVSISLLNVDTFIFHQNLTRFEKGQDLDVGYLAALSSDLIPAVVEQFESPAVSNNTKERLGAVLSCMSNNFSSEASDQSWQAFHMSNYQAQLSMQLIGNKLAEYKIDKSEWPVKITSPSGVIYQCTSDTMMD